MAMGYGLGFNSQQGHKISPLHSYQNGSGAHPASYPMRTAGSFLGAGWGVKLTTHLMPKSRMVKLYLYSLIHPDGMELN
jgi:hypothetical protein